MQCIIHVLEYISSVQFSTPAYAPYLYYFPVTFLTYDISIIDGMSHSVQLYYDNTAEVRYLYNLPKRIIMPTAHS